MSELSTELRTYYRVVLSREGGTGIAMGGPVLFLGIVYGLSYFLTNPLYFILAALVALIGIIIGCKNARREQIQSQRQLVEGMPDDQLASAYAEHQKTSHRVSWLWAIAGIAIVCGLLFTPQGNIIFGQFLNGFHK